MRRTIIAAVAALFIVEPATAEAISVARIPLAGGTAVFELYMDRALLPECRDRGSHPSGLIAKLDTPKGTIPYGTGCWIARIDGNIWMAVKSFDDGVVREVVIHNSRFTKPGREEPTAKVKELIRRVDQFATLCRDRGTEEACNNMEAAFKKVMDAGWCWGPDDVPNSDRSWIPCRTQH